MHRVKRNEAPDGLIKKHLEFQNEYKNIDASTEWQKFSSTKLKKETVEKLQEMYKGCCAYCEGEYVGTSYPQIDHFKPKHLYPELTFDYNNMNLSCEKCNQRKSDKFDEKLIDPSKDEPDEHIKFEKWKAIDLDERGKISIDIYDLNSEKKIYKRTKNYLELKERIDMIYYTLINAIEKNELKNSLKELLSYMLRDVELTFEPGMEYCTTYRHNFEEDVLILKKYIN